MKLPHIEIVSYQGMSGGFATTLTTRWVVRIVGINGKKHILSDFMSDGYGESDRSYVDKRAKEWSELLGLTIVERHLLGRLD